MDIELSFPGGKRVHAKVGNHLIETDQPAELGGEDGAPAPYDLFLASLATCAGIYALGFMQARGLDTQDLRVVQHVELDPVTHQATKIALELGLPVSFPEKYRSAIVRAVENCKVKKTIAQMPTFEVIVAQPQPAEVLHV